MKLTFPLAVAGFFYLPTQRSVAAAPPTKPTTEKLVTGDTARIGDIVAGTGATLKFYFTPRPPLPGTEPSLAYPPGWSINGQKLTAPSGGFTSAWITQIEGWDPDGNGDVLLLSFQDKIDANGFKGVNASPPNPGCDLAYPPDQVTCPKHCVLGTREGEPCSQYTDCPNGNSYGACSDLCFACSKRCVGGSANGLHCFQAPCPGGTCSDPCPTMLGEQGTICSNTIAGICDWGWQNTTRADWVMAADAEGDQTPAKDIVSPTGPIFAGVTNPNAEIFDSSIGRYYTGTLILPIPACARGTYTIGHKADETLAQDEAQPANNIPVAAMVAGVLEIPVGSCCTDFTAPSAATCTAGATLAECNALSSSNLHIFRDGVDCSTPCEVGCVTAADCDDGVDCTTDVCVDTSHTCLHIITDSACDDGLYCNGMETCTADGCQPGNPPCAIVQMCDELTDSCGLTPIPTVSQWGLAALASILLIAAKIRFRNRSTTQRRAR